MKHDTYPKPSKQGHWIVFRWHDGAWWKFDDMDPKFKPRKLKKLPELARSGALFVYANETKGTGGFPKNMKTPAPAAKKNDPTTPTQLPPTMQPPSTPQHGGPKPNEDPSEDDIRDPLWEDDEPFGELNPSTQPPLPNLSWGDDDIVGELDPFSQPPLPTKDDDIFGDLDPFSQPPLQTNPAGTKVSSPPIDEDDGKDVPKSPPSWDDDDKDDFFMGLKPRKNPIIPTQPPLKTNPAGADPFFSEIDEDEDDAKVPPTQKPPDGGKINPPPTSSTNPLLNKNTNNAKTELEKLRKEFKASRIPQNAQKITRPNHIGKKKDARMAEMRELCLLCEEPFDCKRMTVSGTTTKVGGGTRRGTGELWSLDYTRDDVVGDFIWVRTTIKLHQHQRPMMEFGIPTQKWHDIINPPAPHPGEMPVLRRHLHENRFPRRNDRRSHLRWQTLRRRTDEKELRL